jgi:uncharacterized protein (DUF1810 family)
MEIDLERFVTAQEGIYADTLAELRSGRKRTHWMWFIFPQIDGLAMSATSKRYAIRSLAEARAYLDHPILGPRIIECCETLLALEGRSAAEIFGYPDDLKLRSSMTLFSIADPALEVFHSVLDKYFIGMPDERTIQIVSRLE